MKVSNCLKWIVNKTITYNNELPTRNQELILQRKVKYVEDIVVTRNTAKTEM